MWWCSFQGWLGMGGWIQRCFGGCRRKFESRWSKLNILNKEISYWLCLWIVEDNIFLKSICEFSVSVHIGSTNSESSGVSRVILSLRVSYWVSMGRDGGGNSVVEHDVEDWVRKSGTVNKSYGVGIGEWDTETFGYGLISIGNIWGLDLELGGWISNVGDQELLMLGSSWCHGKSLFGLSINNFLETWWLGGINWLNVEGVVFVSDENWCSGGLFKIKRSSGHCSKSVIDC